MPDGAAGDVTDDRDRLAETEGPRPGQLVDAPAVTVPGQCRHRDRGDVLGVDERGPPVTGRQGQLAGKDSGAPEVLAEVLREPVRPQNDPLPGVGPDSLLGRVQRVAFSSGRRCGEQDHPPAGRHLGERRDPGVAQVGFEQVDPGHAVERADPRPGIVQVEPEVAAGARGAAHGQPRGLQAPGDAAAGLAGAAENQECHVTSKVARGEPIHGRESPKHL